MSIVYQRIIEPGKPVRQGAVTSKTLSTKASDGAALTARLACTSEGNLARARTYRGELRDIVKRFWAD